MKNKYLLKKYSTTFLTILFTCFISIITIAQVEKTIETIPFDCAATLSEIKKFKNVTPSKDWKVVVGKSIEYKAKANSLDSYTWTLSKAGNFVWTLDDDGMLPIITPVDGGNNTMFIPSSTIPAQNADFGDNTLHVTALNGTEEEVAPDKSIKVFFDKDESNPHAGLNDEGDEIPNWFYYWSQLVQPELAVAGIKLYNPATETFNNAATPVNFTLKYREDGDFEYTVPPPGGTATNTLGANLAANQMHLFQSYNPPLPPGGICNDFRRVIVGYDLDRFVILIGEGCGFSTKSYDYGPGPNPSNVPPVTLPKIKGIDVFNAKVHHELEHWLLYQEFWAEGYDSALDCDLDYYPDAFEDSDIGMNYGFDSTVEDNYIGNYDPENLIASSPATHYQEDRCRRKEITCNTGTLHPHDWSFDKTTTNPNQGKNWD